MPTASGHSMEEFIGEILVAGTLINDLNNNHHSSYKKK